MKAKKYIFAYSELELRLAKEFQRIFFPLIRNNILFFLSIDSNIDYPIILHDSHQMSSVYTVLLSDVRYIPVISNEHMLIPTVDDSRHSDFRYSQMLITPSILALEMLYLKLQLE